MAARPPPRIHLVSDLHLEKGGLYPTYLEKIDAQILILAGDIGAPFTPKYQNFIKYCAQIFSHVIVVAGNHEYYNKRHNMAEIDAQIDLVVSAYANVHYLQRRQVTIEDITFVGCTLWSLPNASAPLTNDFKKIKGMTFGLYRHLFHTDLKYLSHTLEQIEPIPGHKTVVITHHLPSPALIAAPYRGDPTNTFYATNIVHLMAYCSMWVCGHTHHRTTQIINGCECHINPYGYPSESPQETGFDPTLILSPPSPTRMGT
jgi:predicted phosphodiesterase